MINQGNLDAGVFNQDDKDFFVVSAKRTQKRAGATPAIATTSWSRPLAASPKAAFVAFAEDTTFQVSAAWRADNQNKFSKEAANNNVAWTNGKILKLQKKQKAATALQVGAAALVLATASLL